MAVDSSSLKGQSLNASSDSIVGKIVRESGAGVRAEVEESILLTLNSAKASQQGKTSGKKVGNSRTTRNDVNVDSDAIAMRVAEVLVPVIAKQIESLFVNGLDRAITGVLEAMTKANRETLQQVQRSNLQLHYALDRQEQYTRRETIRIVNLPEEEDENLDEKVSSLFKATGCEVKASDISVVHRNGKKLNGKCRPVLVKFLSRRLKGEVMKKKKR